VGHIRHLGPVEMFECSTCKERYVGPREDKLTKQWIKNHGTKHWVTGRGVPYWGED